MCVTRSAPKGRKKIESPKGRDVKIPEGDSDNSRGQSEDAQRPKRLPRDGHKKRPDPEGVAEADVRLRPFRVELVSCAYRGRRRGRLALRLAALACPGYYLPP